MANRNAPALEFNPYVSKYGTCFVAQSMVGEHRNAIWGYILRRVVKHNERRREIKFLESLPKKQHCAKNQRPHWP
jgi:F420-0:gamma-glutamyl ligase-like protein